MASARAHKGHQARRRPRLRGEGRSRRRNSSSSSRICRPKAAVARGRKAPHRPGPPALARGRRHRRARSRRRIDRPAGRMERGSARAPHCRPPPPGQACEQLLPAPGLGARVLDAGRTRRRRRRDCARLFGPGHQDPGQAQGARLRRLLAPRPTARGRALPVEKRGGARGILCAPQAMAGEARDGDLVAIESLREGRLGPPHARVVETIGSVKSDDCAR